MATFSDDFNRADAADLGANWTNEDVGSWSIVSNQAAASTTTAQSRANTDLGSPNMFVQARKTAVGVNTAIAARWIAGAITYYFYRDRNTTASRQLVRVVGGTTTALASSAVSGSVPYTERLEVNGSQIVCYTDGVETLRATDTGITTGNYGGLRGAGGANTYDDYASGSLNAMYPKIIMF